MVRGEQGYRREQRETVTDCRHRSHRHTLAHHAIKRSEAVKAHVAPRPAQAGTQGQ